MTEQMAAGQTVADRLTGLSEAAAAARRGALSAEATTAALSAADELIGALGLLAFPVSGYEDESLEQVVVTVHGVDVSVRGRRDDMFVHIEDQRDDESRATMPLTVEVNQAGEVSYADLVVGDHLRGCRRSDRRPVADATLVLCTRCLSENGR